MPTLVKRNSFVAAALLLTAPLCFAQDDGAAAAPAGSKGKAPATPAAAPSQPPPMPTLGNTTGVDNSTATALDYLFNHKAQEGTTMKASNEVASAIADKIKAVDVLKTPGLDDPLIRARFNTYLSLKEVPQARIDEYFAKMKQVTSLLKSGNTPDTFSAWRTLYALGDYQDLDAGISRELAARVENFWNTSRTKDGLTVANDDLKKDIEKYNHNADLDATELQYQQSLSSSKPGKNGASGNSGGNSGGASGASATNSPLNSPNADPTAAEAQIMPTLSGALQGKLEMTAEYLNMLESRANIKLNEIRANKMSDQDRMDFADYIRTLYRNHRYYHVIIAADFYRAIFNEGDYPQDLTNAAMQSLNTNTKQAADTGHLAIKSIGLNATGPVSALNQLGGAAGSNGATDNSTEQPLTIADEVTSALEINHRVDDAVDVFKYKAGKGEVAAAADELEQAFVGNEFHPALQGLMREDKEKVGDFIAKVDVLKNQLEFRQFEQVEGQIADIKKIASDFDATKPLAVVNGIKLEAKLRLGKARLLAQGGDLTSAMQEFQTAAEEWPGNPDLTTSSNTFFKTENAQNQATDDFDRMVKEENYRGIFDRQLEFALAVKGDATREQQMKDAMTKVGAAKMAEEKANALIMNGDVNGAWETVELAVKDWPDDAKLNKLLANLSGRSADFVSALNKARDAESKKQYGYSLNWYVTAQSDYPSSQIANDGIERVKKEVLTPAGGAADTN